MSNLLPFQTQFRTPLAIVKGNVDHTKFECQLKRIDEILRKSGVEEEFMERSLSDGSEESKKRLKEASESTRLNAQKHSRQALRCNIARTLMGESVRNFSILLAGMPLLQRFCEMDAWGGEVRVASKSTLDRYARWLPKEEMREVLSKLFQAVDGLGLEKRLDMDTYFLDTTCVKSNIHIPVDWVLLRDAVRTLMKAIILIRNQGLKHRMGEPKEFLKQINRFSIEMTHTRRRKNAKEEKKRVLRCMKDLVRIVKGHAIRYRDLLDKSWEETEWTRSEANQVLKRIDSVLEQLPQAVKQAHERIIGERQVSNKDKILSLYERETNVIVRGKAGAEVEFGNTLLLGETKQGLIVDWKLWKESAPADSKMLKESLQRVKKLLGVEIKNVGGDRGFDSEKNRVHLKEKSIYNGICPRDPKQLKQQMKKSQFVKIQKRRSQTEGRIGIFKNNFLGRPLRAKGFNHRELVIEWAVLAHNLWVLARLPQAQTQTKAA